MVTMHLSMSVGGVKKREALLKWAVNWQQRRETEFSCEGGRTHSQQRPGASCWEEMLDV